jgi:cytochrome c-type biogenesis protein CcmH/NrfG
MRRHDWSRAITLLERDILVHPLDPWSQAYLGSCHYELRNYEVALTHFRKAQELAPDSSVPLGLQADVFHARGDRGDREKAGELYRRALAMDPDDELARKNMDWWDSESAKRLSG